MAGHQETTTGGRQKSERLIRGNLTWVFVVTTLLLSPQSSLFLTSTTISFPLSLPGYPVINDPLYNHEVFGPAKGKGGDIGGKTDEQLVKDLINIHNAENWLGIDGDSDLSLFKPLNPEDVASLAVTGKGNCSDYEAIIGGRANACLHLWLLYSH